MTGPLNSPDKGPKPSGPVAPDSAPSTLSTLRTHLNSPATLALVLRLVGFHLTSYPELLERSQILSTPFDGWRGVKEGIHIHTLSPTSNPYSSSQIHHHPIYLSLFTALSSLSSIAPITPGSSHQTAYVLSTSIFILADWASARALRGIWGGRQKRQRTATGSRSGPRNGVGVGWSDGDGEGQRKDKEKAGVFENGLAAGTQDRAASDGQTIPAEGRAEADESMAGRSSNGRRRRYDERWEEHVMSLFLLNPYSTLSCLARSTKTIDNALVLTSIGMACTDGSLPFSMFLLALATHTSLYPVLMLPFLILVQEQFTQPPSPEIPVSPAIPSLEPPAGSGQSAAFETKVGSRGPRLKRIAGEAVAWYIAGFFAIYAVAEVIMGGRRWEHSVWHDLLAVSDLTPNVGLSWYLFTEMFDHFRPFFIGVFQMHLLVYVAPLCLRLRDQPLLATTIMTGIISTFKSYPAWGDAPLWIGLLGCFPDLWSSLRHPLLTICVHLYTLILLPLLHHLWLVAGTGNANFFYAATLVYGLGCGMGVVDLLAAGIKDEVGRKAVAVGGWEVEGESAEEALMARGLHIVQFATLD